jgi:ribosomal subunit interface protein
MAHDRGTTTAPSLQITYRDFSRSLAVEEVIKRRMAALEHIYPRITSCRVAVEAESRRRRHGAIYRVRIDLRVPEGEFVVGHAHAGEHAHEDVYVAIRDAFDGARRRLKEYMQRHRGRREQHAVPDNGRVSKLSSDSR